MDPGNRYYSVKDWRCCNCGTEQFHYEYENQLVPFLEKKLSLICTACSHTACRNCHYFSRNVYAEMIYRDRMKNIGNWWIVRLWESLLMFPGFDKVREGHDWEIKSFWLLLHFVTTNGPWLLLFLDNSKQPKLCLFTTYMLILLYCYIFFRWNRFFFFFVWLFLFSFVILYLLASFVFKILFRAKRELHITSFFFYFFYHNPKAKKRCKLEILLMIPTSLGRELTLPISVVFLLFFFFFCTTCISSFIVVLNFI